MFIHDMSTNQKLRFAIRYVLETDAISVRQLGLRCKKPHAHISKILSGKIPDVRVGTWDALAAALGTTVRDLLQMPDELVVKAKNRRELLNILPRLPPGRKPKKEAAGS